MAKQSDSPKISDTTSLNSLVEQAKALTITATTENRKMIPLDQITQTLGLVRENYELADDASALYVTAISLQKGGCNSNKNTNIILTVDGKKIESKIISGFIRQKCKNASPRQFARQLANEIFEISKHTKTSGNLKIRLEKLYTKQWNDIIDPDKDYWASDFQSNNPKCPDGIQFLIRQNYQETFRKKE
jgi:hypothetical protein